MALSQLIASTLTPSTIINYHWSILLPPPWGHPKFAHLHPYWAPLVLMKWQHNYYSTVTGSSRRTGTANSYPWIQNLTLVPCNPIRWMGECSPLAHILLHIISRLLSKRTLFSVTVSIVLALWEPLAVLLNPVCLCILSILEATLAKASYHVTTSGQWGARGSEAGLLGWGSQSPTECASLFLSPLWCLWCSRLEPHTASLAWCQGKINF